MISGGSYWPLVTRPVSLVFVSIALALLARPLWRRWTRRNTKEKTRKKNDSCSG